MAVELILISILGHSVGVGCDGIDTGLGVFVDCEWVLQIFLLLLLC